jgi:serine/threonine protein kinase
MAEEVPANVAVVVPNRRTFPRPFGRYILEKNLSRGGMGEVHLAVARGVGTRCVIKTIRGDLTGDKEFVGRFADEAKIMVRMAHENIIRVFDCGKVGSDFYIAMEYMHGRDLGDILDRAYERGEPMPSAHGLYITKQILRGLDYAHALTDEHGRPMRLVHRDISPQNVLIGFDGSVKIIDFGLARTELLPARTQGALAVGKYGYMSPEQARHEKIDGRADLYSTGVMLFEVFTGDRLVDEQDQATLWSRVLNPKHRRPSTVISDLPKDIDDLVMRAVEVRADDRFADAKSMLRHMDGMKSRASDRGELVQYLRYLYPHADFSAPAIPDFVEMDVGEQSMVIAMSEEGAKSVFGKGDLPIEWTRQVNLADLQKERRRRDEEKKKVPEPELRTWDEPSSGTVEATVIQDEDRGAMTDETRASPVLSTYGPGGTQRSLPPLDEPTAVGRAVEDGMPSGTLTDFQRTAYDKKPVRLRAPDEPTTNDTVSRHQGFGEAAIREEHFRDEEATVMMSAPPRNGWADGDGSQDDVNVATRLIANSPEPRPSLAPIPTPPAGTNTGGVSPVSAAALKSARAIQEKNSALAAVKDPGLDRTLIPTSRDPARDVVRDAPRSPNKIRDTAPVVVMRQSIGVESTPSPSPSERTREVQTPVRKSGPNYLLLGLFLMGIAIIVLLLILIARQS